MIQTDIGDYRKDWSDDVRAVQSSAESDFNHGNVYLHILEVFEGHSRCHLKERGVQRFEEALLLLYKVYDIVFGDGAPVDADTFAEIYEVR